MFNSIRTKLTFWYVAVLALVVIGFAALTHFVLVNALSKDTDERLIEMSRNFGVAIMAEQDDETNGSVSDKAIAEAVAEMRFRDYQFVVSTSSGKVIATTLESEVVACFGATPQFRTCQINGETFRVYESPLPNGPKEYTLSAFHSLKEQEALKGRVTDVFLIGVPLTLLLAGFGGYFLARKSLAPVVEMGRQASQIGAGNLNERISIKNKDDELGDLATVFNDLLARLDASFEQQRRFMADASHELRTPLAIVRGEAEVALSKEDRSTAEYRESLSILLDESKRLTKIVEDLFTLARADAGQFKATFAPVYLDEIVGESVRSMRVLAEQRQIELDFSSETELPCSGDESLLRRLFLNLIDNAVKYSRSGGKVSVTCVSTDSNLQINILDQGRGMPEDEQTKIFQRFYRVDKARGRSDETETSGAGLGLSIARWIADIHDGNITLVSSTDDGSLFSVTFPR